MIVSDLLVPRSGSGCTVAKAGNGLVRLDQSVLRNVVRRALLNAGARPLVSQ